MGIFILIDEPAHKWSELSPLRATAEQRWSGLYNGGGNIYKKYLTNK